MSYWYSTQKIQTFIKQIWNKECHITSAKSSGPGGQNVNKRETKVQLSRDFESSCVLPEPHRTRFGEIYASFLTDDGVLRIDAHVHRTQDANKKLLRKKFERMIYDAFKPPKAPRKKTKPPKRAVEKRLAEKKKRAKIRASRKPVMKYEY